MLNKLNNYRHSTNFTNRSSENNYSSNKSLDNKGYSPISKLKISEQKHCSNGPRSRSLVSQQIDFAQCHGEISVFVSRISAYGRLLFTSHSPKHAFQHPLRNYSPIVHSPQNAHAFDNYAPTWMRRALRFFFFKYSLRLRASILQHYITGGEAGDDATVIMIVGLGEVEIDPR